MALSRDSGFSVSPDESCKFGATSSLEELDDGALLCRRSTPGLHVCQVVCE